jgi:hypothetical protein
MKIGILTFHSSINPGSVLQAYCVYNLLKESFPNSNVEIINLVPLNREISEWNFISKKPPFIKWNSIQKYKSIRKFIKNNTHLSKRVYYSNMNAQIRYLNKQKYDFVFTGSDTVWVHSSKFKGLLPTIYFLPLEIEAKKISIAASVDPLIDERYYLDRKNELKAILNTYSLITVRDKTTKCLLQKLDVQSAQCIADPTMLFDFELSLNIKIDKIFKKEKRKVMIWLPDAKLEAFTKKIIASVLNNPVFVSKNTKTLNKENYITKLLNSYSEIDIIITDRFHRSIFGVKLTSALVINIERESKNPVSGSSKGHDLFTSIGIPEYSIRYEKKYEDQYKDKIIKLILAYNEEMFLKREQLLKAYIHANQRKWKKLMSETFKVA